jgi:hypothetical protein
MTMGYLRDQLTLFLFGPDPERVKRQRDLALARIQRSAEDRYPGFGDDAEACVLRLLEQQGPMPGEQLTLACKADGIVPHDDRAFGPVYSSLRRQGLIVPVGSCRRLRGNLTAGGIVWARAAR